MGQSITGQLGLNQYVRRLDVFERWKRRRDTPRDVAELIRLADSGELLPITNIVDVNQDDE